MRTETEANESLQARAVERARWAAVLARPAGFKPAAPRRGFWSLFFSL